MVTHNDQWFEIWFSDGTDIVPSHLLILTPGKNQQGFDVIDPLDNFKTIFHAQDYEEATSWLLEDEFNMVRGREFPDDGW